MIYRFYILENGELHDGATIVCDNDAVAIKDALLWSQGSEAEVEIRESDRVVGALVGNFVLIRKDLFAQFELLNSPPISPEMSDGKPSSFETGSGLVDEEDHFEEDPFEDGSMEEPSIAPR
jgi:hypothetical protein